MTTSLSFGCDSAELLSTLSRQYTLSVPLTPFRGKTSKLMQQFRYLWAFLAVFRGPLFAEQRA
jgi:hypothetical protein